jgi:hypothetical protein
MDVVGTVSGLEILAMAVWGGLGLAVIGWADARFQRRGETPKPAPVNRKVRHLVREPAPAPVNRKR